MRPVANVHGRTVLRTHKRTGTHAHKHTDAHTCKDLLVLDCLFATDGPRAASGAQALCGISIKLQSVEN